MPSRDSSAGSPTTSATPRPGAATARFHAAIAGLMDSWEEWHGHVVEEDEDDELEPEEAELDD